MLETGCSMKEIRDKTGTNHYNLVDRLTDAGHEITKMKGVLKLTHKDDVKSSKKKSPKKDKKADKKKSKKSTAKKSKKKAKGKKK